MRRHAADVLLRQAIGWAPPQTSSPRLAPILSFRAAMYPPLLNYSEEFCPILSHLATRGQQALRRMGVWSIRENIDGVLRAVDLALSRAKAKVGVR